MTVRLTPVAAALAALCATAVGLEWQGLPPQPRQLATIVIDKPNRRAVMFGGGTVTEGHSDVWTLALDSKRGYAWESLPTSGPTPGPRVGHTAIYDPIHRWMVVFGGRSGMSMLDDVWALDLTNETWQLLPASGTHPPGTIYTTAVYSPVRRSMVVFGGNDDNRQGYNDVYELLLDSMRWRKLSPSGTPPEARWSYNAFYGSGDAWCDRLIIFGGQTARGQFVNDLWALDLTPGFEAWEQLSPGGAVPSGRSNCATCFDTATRRAYFFGGFKYTGSFIFYNDLYMLDMMTLTWTRLDPAGRIPSERRCAAGAFDPWNGNFITFGGQTYDGFTNEWPYIYVGEAAARHGGSGNPVSASAVSLKWQGLPPEPRSLATVVVDKPNRRAVMFGGGTYGDYYSDVWTLSLDEKRGYAWESLSTSGPTPVGRAGHSAVYDPIHNWMVVFGGRNYMTALTDVWALDLGSATWQQLTPSGAPPSGRVFISAVFSPVRRSMVVFGGQDLYNGYNDVYELLLDSMKWREILPSGRPPEARWSYNAFLGSGREWVNRLMVFGGQTQSGRFVNDLWSLDLTPGFETWTELDALGSIPEGRSNCATGYDTVGLRAYFFGGFNFNRGVYYNDLYMLDMKTLTWFDVNPTGRIPSERRCPAGAFDPWNRNFITFGGQTYEGFTNEWPYIYVGEAVGGRNAEPNRPPSLQVTPVSSRQVRIRFVASGPGNVNVKVMDQSGRVIRNLLSGTTQSGSHDLVWDGRDGHGNAVASGCYFCCLETGSATLSRKLVLAR